ncbi:MAG: hypothetical protein ACLFV5_07775 [Anaerolineales bacterium]
MLNILGFLLNLVDKQIIWLYAGCALLLLFHLRAYLLARSARTSTIFSIEKEVATHKEGRAMSNIGMVLGLVVVITALKYYVVPTVAIEEMIEPTPTVTMSIPTSVPAHTPTAVLTPTETPTPQPSPSPTPIEEPTNTPPPPTDTPPPAPACPDPNTCIMSPRPYETVSGVLTIRGTANHERFDFYKVEWGQGENPEAWYVIDDIVRSQVSDGVLQTFDTTVVSNGTYSLKLTVVDMTGNFPPPHRVPVTIQN